MKIEHGKIILRDMCLDDINDYVLWYTKEREWQNWDAPWEKNDNLDIEKIEARMKEKIKSISGVRRRFEVCLKNNEHVGWVNSYYVDENEENIALGIDIVREENRGNGIGKDALEAFIIYILQCNKFKRIYIETWSGNVRMINLALSLGFMEVLRKKDDVFVNNRSYDNLRFELNN